MRKALRVAALVLALGCPILAGEIHNPAPQPAPSTVQEPAANSEIPTPPAVGETAATSLTHLALELLAVLPSLL